MAFGRADLLRYQTVSAFHFILLCCYRLLAGPNILFIPLSRRIFFAIAEKTLMKVLGKSKKGYVIREIEI